MATLHMNKTDLDLKSEALSQPFSVALVKRKFRLSGTERQDQKISLYDGQGCIQCTRCQISFV